ncbi:MAG: S9 family peptidase [Acidobacteria bacterium]|nr:S9 family peptidase [Acidobacteriota bacterium]
MPRAIAGSILLASLLQSAPLVPNDLKRFRAVGDVKLSPDGSRVAYTVVNNDTDGRPYSQVWIMTLADGRQVPLGDARDSSSSPEWSADGTLIAYSGKHRGKSGLIIANSGGKQARFVSELDWTNSPLPSTGKRFAWAPDSKRIAFVSAVPGPETAEASGDPVVITRYLYKPDHDEGHTRFNDNKRLHIFIADLSNNQVRPLTTGNHYEHSIDWSPNGAEIVFCSNREPNEDQFFNYDILAAEVASGSLRRITATENIEYRPRWSPDGKRITYQGCKRGLTDLETTMEDTHVWLINADGTGRRELGKAIDNRQGEPLWSPDGASVMFSVQERGSVNLYQLGIDGSAPVRLTSSPGTVGSYSSTRGKIAYAFASPSDMAQLYVMETGGAARKVTDLNAEVLAGKELGTVRPFMFISNDNKWEVEAFLTEPPGRTAASKHPLITVIHGGPHAQQGPAFNFRNQVYAGRGWATLLVNYRGSTGYGQAFADGVFGDQNGNEGQDVLYGVSAAMRRNLWIDRDRIGVEGVSYGGQLSAWLVTQTRLFKSSIPTAAIINLVSYNYTTYYNQYEQMTFGVLPHQGNLMDVLWERSALKHVAKVATPVLLVHGENDNDVPVSEAEQYFVALKDVGVKTVFVRYPREGHGIKEVKHVIDWTERSMRWHESHFPGAK